MEIHDFYNKLFKLLHIPNKDNIYNKLVDIDYKFYKTYANLHNIISGGVKKLIEKIKIKYRQYEFLMHKHEDNDRISFSIFNNGKEEKDDACMILSIPKKQNYIHVDFIGYYAHCTVPEMPKMRGGSLLLQFLLNYCKILKDKYPNLIYVQLRDTSSLPCNNDSRKTQMCNLYMLTRGDTWYGKYGFLPFDEPNKKLDIKTFKDYKLNQKLVNKTNISKTNIRKYLIDASITLKLSHKYTNQLIDKLLEDYKGKSVKDFFKFFMSTHDQNCTIFNEIQDKIMKELGMKNLFGKTYFIEIDKIELN